MINHLQALHNYVDRFYHRQFLNRKIANHEILERLDASLNEAFSDTCLSTNGTPTVQQIADKLYLSLNYLSSLLTITTGRNTQQIQGKLIEVAKARLSTSPISVSEISYKLGFDHLQSFSRMFKLKTGMYHLYSRIRFTYPEPVIFRM